MMADLLSRLNQVQSTEWSLHLQVFKHICLKWTTPHADLFATRLNHKVPLYVSPVPDPNAWDIDALNINWSCLTDIRPATLSSWLKQTILLCYKQADQQALGPGLGGGIGGPNHACRIYKFLPKRPYLVRQRDQ